MKTQNANYGFFSLLILLSALIGILGCDIASDDIAPAESGHDLSLKRKPPPPPPPPPPYFTNCEYAELSEQLLKGIGATSTLTLQYVNSPGGTYPASTSATVNGIYFTTPAGTFNVGSGNITFTANGTPIDAGNFYMTIAVQGVTACNRLIPVQNPPAQGPCADPGPTPGSTGCVTFMYMGQEVTYSTVRADDGNIWLQQNLGSPQVAYVFYDEDSYGHYFQWGRWDDGHQVPTGPSVTGSASLRNPSHIPNGNPNFIKGSTAETAWWQVTGSTSDTWSSSPPSVTNGFDPGTAVGPGWHIPTAAEWQNLIDTENIIDHETAFQSNLKLTNSGYRNAVTGMYQPNWAGGNYWSNSAGSTASTGQFFFFDEVYNALIQQANRGYGMNLRLVKN